MNPSILDSHHVSNKAIFKPHALKPGSTIMIVSPSSPTSINNLHQGIKFLKNAGYHVCISSNALKSYVLGYTPCCEEDMVAGTDLERATDLQEAFDNPNIDAIFCSRGGYGSVQLLDYLDLDRIVKSRKIFMGFSDTTTLHLAFNKKGLVTFHGSMISNIFHFSTEEHLKISTLEPLKNNPNFSAYNAMGKTLVSGKAIGITVGGCLTLLRNTIGTPEEPDLKGKILFLEDIHEVPYRVDSMLKQLIRGNKIQNCAGIVIGSFPCSAQGPYNNPNKFDPYLQQSSWKKIIEDNLKPLNIPTIIEYPFGHIENQITVPMGINAELDAEAGFIKFLESACE